MTHIATILAKIDVINIFVEYPRLSTCLSRTHSQHVKRRRFASPIWTEQAQHLSFSDAESVCAYSLQLCFFVRLGQLDSLDQELAIFVFKHFLGVDQGIFVNRQLRRCPTLVSARASKAVRSKKVKQQIDCEEESTLSKQDVNRVGGCDFDLFSQLQESVVRSKVLFATHHVESHGVAEKGT